MNEMANHGFGALGIIARFMPLFIIPFLGFVLVPAMDALDVFKSDTWNPSSVTKYMLIGIFLVVVPSIIVPVEMLFTGYVWVIFIGLGVGFVLIINGLDYAKKAPAAAREALSMFKQRSLLVGSLALAIGSVPAIISVVK